MGVYFLVVCLCILKWKEKLFFLLCFSYFFVPLHIQLCRLFYDAIIRIVWRHFTDSLTALFEAFDGINLLPQLRCRRIMRKYSENLRIIRLEFTHNSLRMLAQWFSPISYTQLWVKPPPNLPPPGEGYLQVGLIRKELCRQTIRFRVPFLWVFAQIFVTSHPIINQHNNYDNH